MQTIEKPDYMQERPTALDNTILIQHFNLFSAVTTECFYVLDISQKRFCYVKSDDLFLCGYSVGEAMEQGCEFYSKVVYPEDLPLWMEILMIIFQRMDELVEKRDEIDYLSCSFRLVRRYSFIPHPMPQMVYQRMAPIWVDDKLRYLVCSLDSSTVKKAGNLCIYNKNGLAYEEYNFTTKRWKRKERGLFTEREKAILMLARQGKTTKEIAEVLCKGHNTIRNQIKRIFSKLNVHSILEAIDVTSKHQQVVTGSEQ